MDKPVIEGYNQSMKVLPSQDYLNNIFNYNSSTGKLVWKVSPAYQIKMGSEAGWLNNRGYRMVMIDGCSYRVARVIWKMVHGVDPVTIDHINGIKTDDRLVNLRSVSHPMNQRNRSIHGNNKSGVIGVSRYKRNNKWVAQIVTDTGKKKNLGYFESLDDAIHCRKQAELKYGYHDNHGRIK